jgi:hypothetical protein
MTRIYFYIIIVMFLTLQPVSRVKAGVVERNSFLTEMLSLAEKPNSYFIIDLSERKLILMARGISIREWTVDKLRFMGEPLPVKPFLLESKSLQLESLRNHIDIDGPEVKEISSGDNNTRDTADNKKSDNKDSSIKKVKKFELIALELDDMPADYSLFLSGGAIINVRSQAEGSDTFIKKTGSFLKWYVYYPLVAISSYYHKTAFTKIDMSFKDKTEAQALFWAFTEKTECIVLPPGTENRDDFQF